MFDNVMLPGGLYFGKIQKRDFAERTAVTFFMVWHIIKCTIFLKFFEPCSNVLRAVF